MDILLNSIVWLLFLLLACTTLLPFTRTQAWWIRCWDFPRVHIAGLGVICCVLALWVTPPAYLWITLVSAGFLVFQTAKILPYTPLYPTEITLEPNPPENASFLILAANVLKENKDRSKISDLILSNRPEILLLMETDTSWDAALAKALDTYKTVESFPRDDHYGMIFATNLDVTSFDFKCFSDDETPTAVAALVAPNGAHFSFIGLHPRPPVPGVDTSDRDEQIHTSATIAHKLNRPVICMGDFNDVAWSRTSKLVKKRGQFSDPRVGRGFFSSFDATHPLLRFPIDQMYVTRGARLVSFGRGPDVGSDHFPMMATVFIDP